MAKKFKIHNMYSKTGIVEKARTLDDHNKLEKLGYNHKSPLNCWKGYERVPGTKKNAKGSCRKK
jgi:hypothetical protein|tara:strand:- start:98 stop:289 length:192 start_codon:yes stop_codon:yes gene_type:complete